MIRALLISTECYPAAKAGGMGDVVGALPIYLPEQGVEASVVIPKYETPWLKERKYSLVKSSHVRLGKRVFKYKIEIINDGSLSYPFYTISIPGLFDRPSIYLDKHGVGYEDESTRNIAFQTIICDWILDSAEFDVLHCHDHMTGLIPFFLKYCDKYEPIKQMPVLFTIHNGMYRGVMNWKELELLPSFPIEKQGLLDWDGSINSLATAVKCAWQVNTVSPNYMKEIMNIHDSFKYLYSAEGYKCIGILNGVDIQLWNPKTDAFLDHQMIGKNVTSFKSKNKAQLLSTYQLRSRRPLIGFIGRMAHQKGADLLAKAIADSLESGLKFAVLILGSGNSTIEEELTSLAKKYPGDVHTIIAYNEGIARSLYAGCDYMIMPSRFEPCGLNQLFSYRYGTIPIASPVGGLVDTVVDIEKKDGTGIMLEYINQESISTAISRAIDLYRDKSRYKSLRKKIIELNYSWSQSATTYSNIYRKLKSTIS